MCNSPGWKIKKGIEACNTTKNMGFWLGKLHLKRWAQNSSNGRCPVVITPNVYIRIQEKQYVNDGWAFCIDFAPYGQITAQFTAA